MVLDFQERYRTTGSACLETLITGQALPYFDLERYFPDLPPSPLVFREKLAKQMMETFMINHSNKCFVISIRYF